ncbi:MAG: LysM peptidoglycan-binding domain-containing protein [Pseudomonadota bacterium]
MRKLALSLFLTGFMAISSHADTLKMQPNAPDRYVVVKGDTLWDISGKFLKDPWKWPQIWGMNKQEIQNPHWIYPGDVIVLDRSGANPRLSLLKTEKFDTVKLSPKVRVEPEAEQGVPSIPASAVNAFISQPFVMDEGALNDAPRIIGAQDDRMVLATGDQAYATNGKSKTDTLNWKILRPGKELKDPDTQEVLGHQVEYLGDAHTVAPGNPQRIVITSSTEEIQAGDRLKPATDTYSFRYIPHPPATNIQGRVISIYGGVSEAGQYATVVLNQGSRNGLDVGTVLAVYKKGNVVDKIQLPDSRSGLLMVYRVFDKVSYALVMQIHRPVNILDTVRNP